MTDYIKREDALKVFDTDSMIKAWHKTESIPSADVAPVRHGHWIYDYCDIVCSECGTRYNDELCYMLRSDCSYHEPRYCLWCGTRMDGEKDEID